MNYRLSLMVMIMTSLPSLIIAEEQTVEELPSIGFLEFLGDWESDQGEWIDPNVFDEDIFAELPDNKSEEDNNDE